MKYELSFIISPVVPETEHKALMEEILGYLKGIDANIIREPYFIGRRKLTYPIKKQKHGFYVFLQFESEKGKELKEFDIKMRHNNNLLRHLFIKLEKGAEKIEFDASKMDEKPVKAKSNKGPAKKEFSKPRTPRVSKENKDTKEDQGVKLEDIDKQLDKILEEPKVD